MYTFVHDIVNYLKILTCTTSNCQAYSLRTTTLTASSIIYCIIYLLSFKKCIVYCTMQCTHKSLKSNRRIWHKTWFSFLLIVYWYEPSILQCTIPSRLCGTTYCTVMYNSVQLTINITLQRNEKKYECILLTQHPTGLLDNILYTLL